MARGRRRNRERKRELIVNLSQIRFSQAQISTTFTDGKSLAALIIETSADPGVPVRSLGRPPWRQKPEPLRCCKIGKKRWLSLDNRRLFCYYAASNYLQRDLFVCVAVIPKRQIPRFKASNVQNWERLQFERAHARMYLNFPRRVYLPHCRLYSSMQRIVDSICL